MENRSNSMRCLWSTSIGLGLQLLQQMYTWQFFVRCPLHNSLFACVDLLIFVVYNRRLWFVSAVTWITAVLQSWMSRIDDTRSRSRNYHNRLPILHIRPISWRHATQPGTRYRKIDSSSLFFRIELSKKCYRKKCYWNSCSICFRENAI